ncbi:hypothetical protein QNI16_21455 [Cytophagaceae bacterium YF14B1]|uniref:CBU-0592-like domain-containing protein n=1 Tax=Xanthocytophaga flava TaxID=3048013 RepID=A0AAE3QTB9_9BACT|nr:hypothetical protein [Xanthocytophaga flavus]MDJ1483080.1 hypothetical protein [Xanthocytophaga flavus]
MYQTNLKLIFDILGWFGAFLFLISYFLLISKRWTSTSYPFHLCNILGGILVGVSAIYDISYPSAFINITWTLIALYGLYQDQIKNSSSRFRK